VVSSHGRRPCRCAPFRAMGRKRGSGRGGAKAPGGGPVSRVVASSPVPLSPAAVLAAALHATHMAATAHGPSPAQVEMVLAALEFSVHVPSSPADVRDRLLACRLSCGSSSLLDGVLAAAVRSLSGGDVDAVKRAGNFVVTGLRAHGCRGHDDSQVATAPVTIGSPPRDDFSSSACGPAKHGPPLHCAESPPPPNLRSPISSAKAKVLPVPKRGGLSSHGRGRPLSSDGRGRPLSSDGRGRPLSSDGRGRPLRDVWDLPTGRYLGFLAAHGRIPLPGGHRDAAAPHLQHGPGSARALPLVLTEAPTSCGFLVEHSGTSRRCLWTDRILHR